MWPSDVVRPSEQLRRVLSGEIEMESAPAAIQSWARFEIYRGAAHVLALPDKKARQAALQKVPPLIRPHVESEVLRLWRL